MNCEGTWKQSCTESLGIFSWNLHYLEKYGKDAQWPDGSAAGFSPQTHTYFFAQVNTQPQSWWLWAVRVIYARQKSYRWALTAL